MMVAHLPSNSIRTTTPMMDAAVCDSLSACKSLLQFLNPLGVPRVLHMDAPIHQYMYVLDCLWILLVMVVG